MSEEPVTEARVLKSLPRRLSDAAIRGLVYSMILWGLFSLVGPPSWVNHHLTYLVIWTGITFAIGSFITKSDALNFPGTKMRY